jgi:hypothetical protein
VIAVAEHPYKLLFNRKYRYVAVFKENKMAAYSSTVSNDFLYRGS